MPTPTRYTTAERAGRVRFRRALCLMAMTLVVPGSAQLVAGNRRVGRVAVRIWLGLLAVATVTLGAVLVDRGIGFTLASDPLTLGVVRIVLMAAAIGWALLFVDAWRLGQPLTLTVPHRRAVVGLNGLLCFGVAGTLLFGAHLVGVQRDFVATMFGGGAATSATDGRYNVLLLGGDSGAGRWGMRPDSLTIASIDAETGRTVLIALPRNLSNFPFKAGSVMDEEFPRGFDADYLNGVSTWAQDRTELFGTSKTPGVDATIMAVEGITDLRINYWAMVNLEGFKDLVDAVGGVRLTVRQPIPVGGLGDDVVRHIPPGTRTLDGVDTLWYARAREGSDDYSRMARQKCVMAAMVEQLSPQTVLRRFEKIAAASTELISTDLPASELDTFMALALQAKNQRIATLSLVPPMINTADPDIALVRQKVAEAIATSDGSASAAGSGSGEASEASGTGSTSGAGGAPPGSRNPPTSVTGGSIGSLAEGYAANDSEDLASAC